MLKLTGATTTCDICHTGIAKGTPRHTLAIANMTLCRSCVRMDTKTCVRCQRTRPTILMLYTFGTGWACAQGC